MAKYALINKNIVTSVIDILDENLIDVINKNEMVIDVTDIIPQPTVGYVLNRNNLELPKNTDLETFEIELNDKKTDFGIKLSRTAINRIGARNKILKRTGAEVTAMLMQLIGVKSLMETGALGTARASCSQLKLYYTEYSDIFDYVIDQINTFENTFGL